MSNVTSIENEIASLNATLQDAEDSHAAAVNAVATDPGSQELRSKAVELKVTASRLREELALLEKLRREAIARDERDAAEVERLLPLAHLSAYTALLDERNSAARELDEVTKKFKAAVSAWNVANEKCAVEVSSFFSLIYKDTPSRSNHSYDSIRLSESCANALSCRLADALGDYPYHAHMSFNYVRRTPGQSDTESIAYDAKIDGELILERMQGSARAKGLM